MESSNNSFDEYHETAEDQDPASVEIAIHSLVCNNVGSVRPIQNTLLTAERQLVDAATRQSGWRTVMYKTTGDMKSVQNGEYVYYEPPPNVSRVAKIQELKAWAHEPTPSEEFNLENLEPFMHWNCSLIHPRRAPNSSFRIGYEVTGSLQSILPMPHYLSGPLNRSNVTKSQLAEFQLRPEFLRPIPFTFPNLPTLEEVVGSRWSRCSWIVPVRGSSLTCASSARLIDPPLVGTTLSSQITFRPLDSRLSNMAPVPASSLDDTITWTKTALNKFWIYLRDVCMGGHLGFMSVAFCDAASIEDRSPASILTELDFLKIYCNIGSAMQIRSAIHIWSYDFTTSLGNNERIRLLKGARFILVDEFNEPILAV